MGSRPRAPEAPASLAATGLSHDNLLKLTLKLIHVRGLNSGREIAKHIRLPFGLCRDLLDDARNHELVEILRADDLSNMSDFRYALTTKGRVRADEALEQNKYIGPAPVSLADYRTQIARQGLPRERVARDTLISRFEDLVVPDWLERRIGPAVNSGRPVLLYGTPGNGKSTIARAVAGAFGDVVYVPYCVEVDGEIIRLYNPIHHERVEDEPEDGTAQAQTLRVTNREDSRWVACRRPIITVGGELSLEMLDLGYSQISRFYDAPLHMKASGGIFIIDDFGRQLVSPKDLMNRWIVPMDRKVDYLTLHNGTTFSLPFDTLLIFSTNLEPNDLMDAAFLRRLQYKIEIRPPSLEDYRKVFDMVCAQAGLTLTGEMFDYIVREVQTTHGQPLSFYQPQFIVDQLVAAAKYRNCKTELSLDLVKEGLVNMSAGDQSLCAD